MTDSGVTPRTSTGRWLLATDPTTFRSQAGQERLRIAILAIEAEAAELPQEWVEERRPEDDVECERLGCEDRTHPVHHRVFRAAQQAPAPEGLDWRGHLNAIRRLLVASPSQRADSIDAAIGYALNDCEAAIEAALATPAEPTSPYTERDEHERQSSLGTHLFDPQCPFCFFDHFDPEARAGLTLATPADPDRPITIGRADAWRTDRQFGLEINAITEDQALSLDGKRVAIAVFPDVNRKA